MESPAMAENASSELNVESEVIVESSDPANADDSVICLDDDYALSDLPLDLARTRCSNEVVIDDDDDLSVVYEKIVPPPDVQIVSNPWEISLAENNIGQELNLQNNSVPDSSPTARSAKFNSLLSVASAELRNNIEIQESREAGVTDDSVCIVGEYGAPRPPVIVSSPHIVKIAQKTKNLELYQKSFLESAEKKKCKIECSVCFDAPDEISNSGRNVISTVCGHIFCDECIKQAIRTTKHCPQCRRKLTAKQFHPLYISS